MREIGIRAIMAHNEAIENAARQGFLVSPAHNGDPQHNEGIEKGISFFIMDMMDQMGLWKSERLVRSLPPKYVLDV